MNIDIIIGIVAFVIISISLYFVNMNKVKRPIKKSKKINKKTTREIIEIKYLMIAYNIKKEKLTTRKFILLISLIDALIITSVFLVVQLLPWAIAWKLMLGFVLMMGLIYSIYHILGRILVKRGFDK